MHDDLNLVKLAEREHTDGRPINERSVQFRSAVAAEFKTIRIAFNCLIISIIKSSEVAPFSAFFFEEHALDSRGLLKRQLSRL